MTDVFTPAKRSLVMSRILSTGNIGTELKLAKLFRAAGITGWRRHLSLPGRPDFTFRAARLAVFTDGCFWHGCPRCYRPPKQNSSYWKRKIEQNRRRDRRVDRHLRLLGWRTIRIRECRIERAPERALQRIRLTLLRGRFNS